MSILINSIQYFMSEPGLTPEPLSQRELEVLQWLASGASNREIGRRLYITENTVKRHVYNIFGKLNVCNRTQAALQARQLGVKSHLNLVFTEQAL